MALISPDDGSGSTDSSTSTSSDTSGTYSETEDLATASGSDLISATADAISDSQGEARPDTSADIDSETSPGRSSIGVEAGLYSGEPSDTRTKVDVDTTEDGTISDVDTSNTVASADDDRNQTQDLTKDQGVETDPSDTFAGVAEDVRSEVNAQVNAAKRGNWENATLLLAALAVGGVAFYGGIR